MTNFCQPFSGLLIFDAVLAGLKIDFYLVYGCNVVTLVYPRGRQVDDVAISSVKFTSQIINLYQRNHLYIQYNGLIHMKYCILILWSMVEGTVFRLRFRPS